MSDEERYLAISPGAIVPEALPDFRIYIRSSGRYVLWAREGNKVSSDQLAKLAEGGLKEVFVDLKDQIKYEQYIEESLGSILENQWASGDQKATIFSSVSANVVKNAFESSLGLGTMSAEVMARTQRMVKNSLIFISESKSLQALAKMIGHDYQTYEHATKVLWFTVSFLRNCPEILELIQPGYQNLKEEKKKEVVRQCGVGAILHDIGKTFVPVEILRKEGSLTEVEWEVMKRHPLNGLSALLDTDLPMFVKKGILQHHEDFNGGGYPMGLAGMNIHVLARVLRIIDTFDAMTSRRPYKASVSPRETVKIMCGKPVGNGGQEDPEQDDRDQGMKRCFDEELLRKFILFLGNVKLDQ
ncbi:MAG: HD domain-containing protein [Deltaproteobacteria bacterium]|nr:HD domain-containing protein [Deltaproteobacteria bacterium]